MHIEFLGFQINSNSMSISLPSQNGRKIQREAVRLLIEVTNTLSIRTCHDHKENQWQFLELLHRPQNITVPYRWHSILWYLTRIPMETQANTTSGCPWAIKSQLVDSIPQTGCTCNSLFPRTRGGEHDVGTPAQERADQSRRQPGILATWNRWMFSSGSITNQLLMVMILWNGKCINDKICLPEGSNSPSSIVKPILEWSL